MSTLETGKKVVERLTGWSRPSKDTLPSLVRQRQPRTYRFKDDGIIPNHPHWPLVLFRAAVRLPKDVYPPPFLKTFLSKMAGAIPGATASMTMSTIIRAFMRCWESRVEQARRSLVASAVA